MQRRTVPTNGAAQDDPDEVHEVVNLLNTDVRAEYQKPPLHSRIKSFMLQNYRPARLLPVITWLPAYAGKGPGGWRENLYGDVFAGCTVAYVPVPARHAQCGGCERIKSPGSACCACDISGSACCACDISGLSAARRCRRRSIWQPTTSWLGLMC
jgi:hypothetical protein